MPPPLGRPMAFNFWNRPTKPQNDAAHRPAVPAPVIPLSGLNFDSSDRVGYIVQQYSDSTAVELSKGQSLSGFQAIITFQEGSGPERFFAFKTADSAKRTHGMLAHFFGARGAQAHLQIL